MTLEEILADKELAMHKKKSEIQKSDLSTVLLDSVNKASANGIDKLEVLVYEAVIKKDRNEFMFNQYKSGYVLNHSVGMRYVKLLWCYDNSDSDYTQNKENYDKYSKEILNQNDLGKYFWAVLEAKNIEGSAVVKGSNFLTPVLSIEEIDENTIKVKCAISPSNILDSHKDVHIPGLWKKSLSETKYDLLLQEHEMDFDKVITDSVSGSLKVYTQMVSVKDLMIKLQNKEAGSSTSNNKRAVNDTQTPRRKTFIN